MPDAEPQLLLRLDGFEGPMDLLLELARGQKVDLARISILSLVDQYLAIVEGARRVRLELAGDWLVMAAWLTWLKSRLLLPPGTEAAEEGEDAAGLLAGRLDALAQVQAGARWLLSRPQLHHDVFPRGAAERLIVVDRSSLAADVGGLMRAYLAAMRRGAGARGYVPRHLPLWTVADALDRLRRLLGRVPGWTALEQFLPSLAPGRAEDPVQRRAAIASTLLAGLELARGGAADLRQDDAFGPIMVRGLGGG
ncbi:MAG: segregation and condensation protein A [Janthinobacterium lividum]